MRLPFYTISPDRYLFAAKLSATRNANEEPVRQWCAFELIRAYGLTVSDLSFEEEVRVGSKIYRIDVLVRRNGVPWIVIECKEPKHKKHEEGLEQAVSYAGAVPIAAEYAVYTNGTAWLVRRKVEGSWQPVSDIPVSGPSRVRGSIDAHLLTIKRVSPLLHKLDETLAGHDARIYLEGLQRFFHGENLITAEVDHDLRVATDNLLRVLATGSEHHHYSTSKLAIAADCADAFRMKAGLSSPLAQIRESESPPQFMAAFAASLQTVMEAGQGSAGLNHELIRLILSLLDYGRTQAPNTYPPFPTHLHATLRAFLTKAMAISLNLDLPQSLEEKLISDVKHFTYSAWDDLVQNDVSEGKEERRHFFGAFWQSLVFWRRG